MNGAGAPAFAELQQRGLPVRSPELAFATPDHVVSSAPGRTGSELGLTFIAHYARQERHG